MKIFDVIVVGAGPAGSAAAHVLAGQGMKVALVEKHVFPRDKLCGGLLSDRARKEFIPVFGKEKWEIIEKMRAQGASFYYRERYLNGVHDYQPFFFTSRIHFDASLAALAQRKGAYLMEGAPMSSVAADRRGVRVKGGAFLKADFIVGADGVSSRVAAAVSLSAPSKNLALGLEIEMPLEQTTRAVVDPEIYLGVAKWGYGWIFPKRQTQTVGIGGLLTKNQDLKKAFEIFLHQCYGRIPAVRWRGYPIPFGNYKRRPGQANTLLIGDAAGLVEPVTGEGIAFAIQSGRLAAQAIVQAANAGRPETALDHYLLEYRRIANLHFQAKMVRYLIFSAPTQPLFATLLPRSKNVVRKYLDLLAGEIDYKDYMRWAINKLGKRMLPHRSS